MLLNWGWDGWMASPTQWTWVWASSRSWWRTGEPGVLHFLGHKELDITKWLNRNELKILYGMTNGRVEGYALIFCELQNYNSLLNNHRQKNVGSHQKKIPHYKGQRRSPSKMVGGAKSCLESNPIPATDAQKAQKNLVYTRSQRPHRDWARIVFECLLWSYWSAVACLRGRGSSASVGHKSSWKKSLLTPP